MATVIYSENALTNLERALEFLTGQDPAAARDAVVAISETVEMLARHPLIGRVIEGELRELVISLDTSPCIVFSPPPMRFAFWPGISANWTICSLIKPKGRVRP